MKLVVLSDPEWIKYPFIVHRHLNATLEFAQAIDETLTLGYLEGYETGAIKHAVDWQLRRFGVGGYEDVEVPVIYPNERWMLNDVPNLVLAFLDPPGDPENGATRAFTWAHKFVLNGTWVKVVELPVPIPKEPKDAPSAMDVLHGKLAA